MVEHSGSTAGLNPSAMTDGFGAHAPWEDAVGNSDSRTATGGPVGAGSNPAIATDGGGVRFNTVRSMVSNWEDVQRRASSGADVKRRFGLWGIQAGSAPTSYVNSATSATMVWTNNSETASSAQSKLQSADPEPAGADIYGALNSVVQNHFGDGNCPGGASCEKTLVLIVDGPGDYPLPDLRGSGPSRGVAFETLRQNLVDAGVRLFVVHYDTGFDISSGDRNYLALDNPDFYAPQTECNDDSDCFHHQTCQKVDGYASSPGSQISVPENPHATYCVPVRGSDGRLGPVGVYSRLACATGGSYIYRKTNKAIKPAAEWIPYAASGLWEATVSVDGLGNADNLTPGQPVKLQTDITYSIGDSSGTDSLSQQDNQLDRFPSRDTRSVIMNRE